jgi:CRISPR-associated protein Cas5h
MEILSFEIAGKMAHFRKYYANNTAFSFSLPPRTTLMGIVAAAMGWPKDSYYEDLASDNIQFGVGVLSPLKKSFHRLNFLRIGSNPKDFRGYSSRQSERPQTGPIQTPFEVITPLEIRKSDLKYKIYLKATNNGKVIFEKIKNHFLNNEPVYNISLGTANFMAQISNIKLYEKNQIKQTKESNYIMLNSAVPVDLVEDLKFEKDNLDNYNFIEEDMMPGEFVSNGNREVKTMNKLLFSITQKPLRVKLNSSYYQIEESEQIINIQFMDS